MAKYEGFEVSSEMVNGFQKITFSGSLTYGLTDGVREKVFSLLTESQGYILDMRNLELIDSTGFGVLVSFAKKFRKSHHRMVAIVNNQAIHQLFNITKMHLIFPIVPTEQEAVALLSENLSPKLSVDDY